MIERLLRTGWALKAFHLDHRRYPKTLEELVPHYVQEVPVDTVDGNPLFFKGGNNVCILKANTRYIESEVSLFGPATTVRLGGVGLGQYDIRLGN